MGGRKDLSGLRPRGTKVIPRKVGKTIRQRLVGKGVFTPAGRMLGKYKKIWNRSGINPALDYYPDPKGEPGTRCWICGFCTIQNHSQQQKIRTQFAYTVKETRMDKV